MRCALCLSALALVVGQIASADTAYVKPSNFAPKTGQMITAEVAFNDVCCEPRYAVRTEAFRVIGPDGAAAKPDRVEVFADTTLVEHAITQNGTTRITTGERLGRKGEYVQIQGQYHLVNSPDATLQTIPDGTAILSAQTATVSDAYVTSGEADWGAIKTQIGRLAITPLTHPNRVVTGALITGQVTFDGVALADQSLVLTTEMQRLTGTGEAEVKTDAQGHFALIAETPGVHLLMVRLQAPAPAGAETDIRSYTTSLTLDVTTP